MSEMTLEEAFRLLGVSPDCDQFELKEAFHRLSRQCHPDTNNGNSDEQVRINEAREMAFAFILNKNALVPTQLKQSVQELTRSLESERAGRQANEFAAKAKILTVRPLQRIKGVALLLGLCAAAFGWFGNILPSSAFKEWIDAGKNIQNAEIQILIENLMTTFKYIAIVLGSTAVFCQFLIQRYALLVEVFSDELSDAETCAAMLARTLEYADRNEWRPNEMAIHRHSLFGHILDIDPIDRQRLLVLKAVEHGLLEPLKSTTATSFGGKTYKVTFQPSHFRSPPPPPLPPPTVGHAAATGLLAILCVTLTAYLGIWVGTFWAILPGVLTVGFCAVFFDIVTQLRR